MRVKRMFNSRSIFLVALLAGVIFFVPQLTYTDGNPAGGDQKKEDPKINCRFEMKPKVVSPGESGSIILTIETARGIKLTNYPQTTITLTGDKEVVFEKNSVKLGDGKMPDDLMKNYLGYVSPIEFKYKIDAKASIEKVTIAANISYFCCEMKSGICWPGTKSVDLEIPIKKR